MMSNKAKHFGDDEACRKVRRKVLSFNPWNSLLNGVDQILAASKPQVHKSIGRTVKNFNADEWDKVGHFVVATQSLRNYCVVIVLNFVWLFVAHIAQMAGV